MLKQIGKRYLSLVLSLVLILVLLPAMELPALAASVNTGVTGLTAESSGNATWTLSGSTIKGEVKATAESCLGVTSYTPQNGTLTFTNSSDSIRMLSFDYELALNAGSASIDASSVTASASFSKKLGTGESVAIVIMSPEGEGSTSITISNMKLVEERDVTITCKAPTNGSYTVDGTAITAETQKAVKTTDLVALAATPASNYKFSGWFNADTDACLSTSASVSLSFSENMTLEPRFVSSTLPLFLVGNRVYTDLNDATAYATSSGTEKITLISDGTLAAGSYAIPNGVTLLIPFDDAATCYTTTPEVVYGSHANPTAFRTLTMPDGASINVQSGGAICLSGKLCATGQLDGWNGAPTGPDGRIKMETGSSITVQNGGNLYCWGYIYGSGSVEAKSGATVYEAFQIKDWRGGGQSVTSAGYQFIFNQYYIQNIEVPLKIHAGALEKLYTSANASSTAFPLGATLVGNGGMFNISSGYIIKDYIEETDRLHIDVYGDENGGAFITPMTLSGLPMVDSISTDSFTLPITSNITINMHSGESQIRQDVELLPSVEFNIDSGASLTINSEKSAYVYDNDNWGNFTGSARLYVVGYSVANGTKAKRNAASLTDAKINVNGTLNVNGKLYTSVGGANITSSDGTGQIVYTTAPDTSDTTIDECANNKTKTAVTFNPARLHNGTSDPAYTPTAGAAANDVFTYCPEHNKWEKNRTTHTITFKANGGTGTMENQEICSQGGSVFVTENAFTAPGSAQFISWNTKSDGTGTDYAPGAELTLNEDTTLYAQWGYAVTFNLNGAQLAEIPPRLVRTGAKVQQPTLAEWEDRTFLGWYNGDQLWRFEEDTVTQNLTLTAHWGVEITWKNGDSVLKTETVAMGEMPNYTGVDPVKEADSQYTYTFSGWSPTVVAATQNATYTAVFDQTLNKYQISWAYQYLDKNNVMQTGTLKESEEKEYGSQIASWVPSKASDADGVYTFDRWTPSLPATVSGDATYTAVFTRTDAAVITYLPGGGTGATKYQYVGYGLSYKLEANSFAREGYTFLRWIGDNGRTYEKDDLVRVTSEMGHLTLTAEWTPNVESTAQIKIQWYDNYTSDSEKDISNATAFKTDYFDSAERFAEPVAPSHPGYTFYAWAVYLNGSWDASIRETVDSGTTLTTREKLAAYLSTLSEKNLTEKVLDVYALYTNNQTQCPVEVLYKLDGEVVNWTSVIQNVPEQATVGKYLRLNATPEYNGKTFDHWEYDGNTIKTDNLKITPGQQTAGETITIYACYVSGEASAKDLFYIVETYAEVVNGVPKVAVTLGWNLESGSVTEVGFYAGKDQSKVQNKESAKASMKPSNPTNGTYTLHISSKTGTDVPIYALPFATYTDASGQSHPWEGEAITLVWSDLSLKGDG